MRSRREDAAGPGAFGARGARKPSGPLGSQRGAALLALVLALALGSGLVTIEWLEAAARASHAARRTEAALAAARDALIGYAVSYPDQHSGRHGPGYLPCPTRAVTDRRTRRVPLPRSGGCRGAGSACTTRATGRESGSGTRSIGGSGRTATSTGRSTAKRRRTSWWTHEAASPP